MLMLLNISYQLMNEGKIYHAGERKSEGAKILEKCFEKESYYMGRGSFLLKVGKEGN